MKRILVLGSPGSGKTYFSKRLSMIKGLPLVHMDNLYWNKERVSCSRDDLVKQLIPILETEYWILDGNYHHTLDIRFSKCTDVFFLDLPRETCVKGILERIDLIRDDIPWIQTENDAKELIEWTKDYVERTRPLELEFIEKHPEVNITIFHSREEMDDYLKTANEKI